MAQQALALKKEWTCGKTSLGASELRWIGALQPSALSPVYTVSVSYRLGRLPRVKVLDPKLDPGLRDRLPHVYSEDRLCLHVAGDWTEADFLSKTTIPWTAEWLFHYELWKATDVWSGGGHLYALSDPQGNAPSPKGDPDTRIRAERSRPSDPR